MHRLVPLSLPQLGALLLVCESASSIGVTCGPEGVLGASPPPRFPAKAPVCVWPGDAGVEWVRTLGGLLGCRRADYRRPTGPAFPQPSPNSRPLPFGSHITHPLRQKRNIPSPTANQNMECPLTGRVLLGDA